MTDDLRTRIAAVADAHTAMGYYSDYGPNDQWVCDCGWTWVTVGTHGEHVADVLIREIPELAGDCYSWCSLDAGHEGDCR